MLNPSQSLNTYTRLMQPAKRGRGKASAKCGNPKLPPYESEVPFELVDYERLIPPTYKPENEAYAHDIAHSMQTSGWSGRPLWGMELENGELDMRTGSHRWLALGLLLAAGQWPANLPFGQVPVYVMRRQEVPAKVWKAWESADFWEMKDLGDRAIGPAPVVQLMRAERNPRLHEPTPRTIYELWDTSIGAGSYLSVHENLKDFNEAKRAYWAKHPMANLEQREIRTGNPRPPRLVTYVKREVKGELIGSLVAAPQQLAQVLAGEAERITTKTANLTDRALRYRANQTPPPGPRRCLFCSTTRNVGVGHLDGHEENNAPQNLAWNCKSCNAILSARFKELGLGRRTKQFNPAVTWQQYGMAAAAMRGKIDQMTPAEGAKLIRETPPEDRSRFMREIWRMSARRREMEAKRLPF